MATDKEITTDIKSPSFNYFNATNFSRLEASTKQAEKEINSFKNDYSSSRLNKVYEKYELLEEEQDEDEEFEQEELEVVNKPILNRTSDFEFNKLIKEQTNFNEVEETLTYSKIERDPKVKLNLNKRTKLAVFTYSFVVVLLGFLLIYNAFAIDNVTSNINSINENIANEQLKIEKVIKDIGNMTDQDNIIDLATDLSFNEVPMGSVVNVTLYEKQTPATYEGQTNWFDAICKFFNGLFGG